MLVLCSPTFGTIQSCWMWHDGMIVFYHEKDQNLSIIVVIFIERVEQHSVWWIKLAVAVPSIKHLAISKKYYSILHPFSQYAWKTLVQHQEKAASSWGTRLPYGLCCEALFGWKSQNWWYKSSQCKSSMHPDLWQTFHQDRQKNQPCWFNTSMLGEW